MSESKQLNSPSCSRTRRGTESRIQYVGQHFSNFPRV